jgi:aspartyl/asparaginyl-tRNA synthetase
MCFLELRQRCATLQAIVRSDDSAGIPLSMVKYASSLTLESVIDVEGTVVLADVSGAWCTQKDIEVSIDRLFTVSAAVPQLPLQLDDASRSEAMEKEMGKVNQDTALDNRVVDVRTMANQAIFKLQSGVCQLFREFLIGEGFTEIHTPKLISAASEGGANVFKLQVKCALFLHCLETLSLLACTFFSVSKYAHSGFSPILPSLPPVTTTAITAQYFGKDAFLAQSPQLYKQMCMNADFDRVFEIAPVFRAEDSVRTPSSWFPPLPPPPPSSSPTPPPPPPPPPPQSSPPTLMPLPLSLPHARTRAHTHTHTHTCARTRAHTHTRARAHTHTHTHTHRTRIAT